MNQAVANPTPKGRTRVYACGGAAINIIAKLGSLSINAELLSDFEVALIDTSRSNLQAHSKGAECYLLEGLDGSGKVRSENHGAISERIKEILQKHKAGDLNIVLSSGAGGSGSVIGPLLASELLARSIPVIVLMVGSTASTKEAENTLKTLMSYESIAKLRQAPVVMNYLQNSPELPRGEVDKQMLSTITYLGLLYSRRNRELDTKDLHNWLRYTAPITSFEPHLSSLSVLWHTEGDPQLKIDLSKLGNIISVATLVSENMSTDLPVTPEYQASGILPAGKDTAAQLAGKVLNYIIADGLVPQFVKGLNDFLAAQKQIIESRPPTVGILSRDTVSGADGLVL